MLPDDNFFEDTATCYNKLYSKIPSLWLFTFHFTMKSNAAL